MIPPTPKAVPVNQSYHVIQKLMLYFVAEVGAVSKQQG